MKNIFYLLLLSLVYSTNAISDNNVNKYAYGLKANNQYSIINKLIQFNSKEGYTCITSFDKNGNILYIESKLNIDNENSPSASAILFGNSLSKRIKKIKKEISRRGWNGNTLNIDYDGFNKIIIKEYNKDIYITITTANQRLRDGRDIDIEFNNVEGLIEHNSDLAFLIKKKKEQEIERKRIIDSLVSVQNEYFLKNNIENHVFGLEADKKYEIFNIGVSFYTPYGEECIVSFNEEGKIIKIKFSKSLKYEDELNNNYEKKYKALLYSVSKDGWHKYNSTSYDDELENYKGYTFVYGKKNHSTAVLYFMGGNDKIKGITTEKASLSFKNIQELFTYNIELYNKRLKHEVEQQQLVIREKEELENIKNYNPEIGIELTEYFNNEWKRCIKSKASFFRVITYEKTNVPKGKVKDYFISGQLQSEYSATFIDYIEDTKSEFVGEAIWYNKSGNIIDKQFFLTEAEKNKLKLERLNVNSIVTKKLLYDIFITQSRHEKDSFLNYNENVEESQKLINKYTSKKYKLIIRESQLKQFYNPEKEEFRDLYRSLITFENKKYKIEPRYGSVTTYDIILPIPRKVARNIKQIDVIVNTTGILYNGRYDGNKEFREYERSNRYIQFYGEQEINFIIDSYILRFKDGTYKIIGW